MSDSNDHYPSIRQAITLTVSVTLAQFMFGMILGAVLSAFACQNPVVTRGVAIVLSTSAVLAGIGYALRVTRARPGDLLALRRFDCRAFLPILLGALGLGIALSELDNLVGPALVRDNVFIRALARRHSNEAINLITIAIIAPVTEELLFRGVILGGLLLRRRSATYVVVVAVLFACFHLNPYQMLSSFLLGLLLGLVFLKTESVIPCIVAHAFFNIQGILLYRMQIVIPGYNAALVARTQPLWFDAMGCVFLVVSLLLLTGYSYTRRPDSS